MAPADDSAEDGLCAACLAPVPADARRCPDHPDRPVLIIEPSDDPLVGTSIDGRFAVLEAVGRGGMGTVYRAWQRSTAREVAIKTVRADIASPSVHERFRREALITAQLRNPHTVTVFDSGELPDGTLYMVMEYLGGGTLEDVLEREGRLSLPRIRRLGIQLCDSLSEAHALGLVHRDLKLSNLALTRRPSGDEVLVVLDFGVAKLLDVTADTRQLTRDGTTVGSLSTMSPEQIDGRAVGPTSDLYAVGVILYQLATGELPFDAPSALGVMYKHLSTAPPKLDLGRAPGFLALDAIIQRCLRKIPTERFPRAEALSDALAQLPDHEEERPITDRASRIGRVPTRRELADETDTRRRDPLPLRGVTTTAIHRRITEVRMGAVTDPPARRRRWFRHPGRVIAVLVALAAGLYILLSGLATEPTRAPSPTPDAPPATAAPPDGSDG